MLEAVDLAVAYGSKPVLSGVRLAVSPGEILAVVGHNGAGKSTLLKGLFGLARLAAGSVRLDGSEIGHEPTWRRLEAGLAYCPQGGRVLAGLSVAENLHVAAEAVRRPRPLRERVEQVYEFLPLLAERRSQKAGNMSGGERQLLGIGMALVADPAWLLLDEPSGALSPANVERVYERVARLRERGLGLLIVEQNVSVALDVATRVLVFRTGRQVFAGSPDELRRPQALEAYLVGVGDSTGT